LRWLVAIARGMTGRAEVNMQSQYKRLWIALAVVVLGSFVVLGSVGVHITSNAPPIPARVVTAGGGDVVFDGAAIQRGQGVWQSLGGQQIGSIWGHGSYVAPDWTADWLHREATHVLDVWAREGDRRFDALAPEEQAALRARLAAIMRTNTYDPASGTVTIDPARADAFEVLSGYYRDVFENGRDEYAIPRGALTDEAKARDMAAFFWWTSWAASTNRPGSDVTYTNNWPHEPLVNNRPTGQAVVWSVVSFVLLLAGIGGMVWYFAAQRRELPGDEALPATDPLLTVTPTPSQRATLKFFAVALALIVVQVALGAVTAHYGVEGSGFYGIPLDRWLPYSIARTWHTQLGLFWIATTWLATGLYVAPAVGGEPRGQRALVNVLFGALLFVVVGSLTGEWLGIQQRLGEHWFWFGAQGYEYVDLGRFWQILLFGGLVFWLWLMWRALKPALLQPGQSRSLLALFVVSAIAIPLFYGAGLLYGEKSHLVTAEYWRWWVVHLWVEGFFEVFATVVIAFLFTRMKLLSVGTATRAVLFSTVIFLSGGIIGTLHHLYFTGTSPLVLALGATFSALEVVPLVLVGFEAWENIRLSRAKDWVSAYKWPIYFFVAVAFWNFVGAGLFGFLINPPIALYYMQGLNTTPVHGHTALFGVYGMLGIGLLLFCVRGLRPHARYHDLGLKIAFWSINGGLAMMVLLSLLPIGLMQTWASVEHGTWYARSAEFLQTGLMDKLRWMRIPGDTLFALGTLVLAGSVVGLFRRPAPAGGGALPGEPAEEGAPVAGE
jgi:nitric oxide reductase subunit B